MTKGLTTSLSASNTRYKENFKGITLKLGKVGSLISGSVPREQFNFRAFNNDMKSKLYGVSKIKNASDLRDDWYDLKL